VVLSVGTRELKNRLTEYLRLVRAGTSVVVTDRGRPVAELRPVPGIPGVEAEEAWLVNLSGRGLVSLPADRVGRRPATHFRPVRVRGRPVSETILEDRR